MESERGRVNPGKVMGQSSSWKERRRGCVGHSWVRTAQPQLQRLVLSITWLLQRFSVLFTLNV